MVVMVEENKKFKYTNIDPEVMKKIEDQIINPKKDVLGRWGTKAGFINYYLRLITTAYIEYRETLDEFEKKVETALINKNKDQPISNNPV
jgi:hypothetical protein